VRQREERQVDTGDLLGGLEHELGGGDAPHVRMDLPQPRAGRRCPADAGHGDERMAEEQALELATRVPGGADHGDSRSLHDG
jgi:hypothetical protein